MTDISVTAANVKWIGGVRPIRGTGGASVTRGQAAYLNTTTGKYGLGDADTDAASEYAGQFLTDGFDGGDVLIAPPGAIINWGATLTAGTIYTLSTTAGGVCPEGDLATGDYVVVLAIGAGTANAKIIGEKGDAVHA